MAARTQQQAFLAQQAEHAGGPSPAKRQKQSGPPQRPGSSRAAIINDTALEEEDLDGRDLMDLLTARDISQMRYIQHSEWMEEVYSSPFATLNLQPVSLGLGRKGELDSLTNGFFDAPTLKSFDEAPVTAKRLEPGKAEDFAKRTEERIRQLNSEMEEMKAQHAKRMAKITQGRDIRNLEKRIRSLGSSALHDTANESEAIGQKLSGIDEIGIYVAKTLNKEIETVQSFKCVQKGGLEEKVTAPVIRDTEMTGTSTMEQNGTGDAIVSDLPTFDESFEIPDIPQNEVAMDIDEHPVTAGSIPTTTEAALASTAAGDGPDLSDWVVLDKDTSKSNTPSAEPTAAASTTATNANPNPTIPTATTNVVDFSTHDHQDASGSNNFEATGDEFGDTLDFGNLDTAGDELHDFDTSNGDGTNIDGDDSLGVGLDDSAFGDAFHHTEVEAANTEVGGDATSAHASDQGNASGPA